MENLQQTCRRCGKQFAESARVCPFCGTLANETYQDITLNTVDAAPGAHTQPLGEHAVHFMASLVGKQIALYIEDASLPLVIDLSDRATLGRRSPRDTGVAPTIALNRFDAFNRGVSRIHAVMYYENDTLFIVDEYSTNGTWVNGRKLEPMQPTALAHGAEIRLARLRMLLLLNAPPSNGKHKPKT